MAGGLLQVLKAVFAERRGQCFDHAGEVPASDHGDGPNAFPVMKAFAVSSA